jgi:hypothetical protein
MLVTRLLAILGWTQQSRRPEVQHWADSLYSGFRCSVLAGVGVMNRTVLGFGTRALCQVPLGTIAAVPAKSSADH